MNSRFTSIGHESKPSNFYWMPLTRSKPLQFAAFNFNSRFEFLHIHCVCAHTHTHKLDRGERCTTFLPEFYEKVLSMGCSHLNIIAET